MWRKWWDDRREYLSGALWVLPLLFVLVAVAAGSALSQINIRPGSPLDPWLLSGNVDEARRLLLTVATTAAGAIGLVVGLTVVAVQVAANRYSPRLLRNSLRDRPAQMVLGLFVATFAYNAAGLFTVGGDSDTPDEQYARLAVTVGLGLLFLCVGALIYYVDRMLHAIQLDAVLAKTRLATLHAIAKRPPGIGRSSGNTESTGAGLDHPSWAVALRTQRSGYVQIIHLERLLRVALAQDVTLLVALPIGDHVVPGTPLAWVWRISPKQPPPQPEPLERALMDAVTIGFERTTRQDVALGILQIVDIALISMHIFDYYTSVQSANELTSVLSELGKYPLGIDVSDRDVTVRIIVPAPTFDEYLNLACGEIRRRAAGAPLVCRALLRMLQVKSGPLSPRMIGGRPSANRCVRCLRQQSVRATSPPTWHWSVRMRRRRCERCRSRPEIRPELALATPAWRRERSGKAQAAGERPARRPPPHPYEVRQRDEVLDTLWLECRTVRLPVHARLGVWTHGHYTDAPVDLYIAAYADPDAARADWDAIKQLATDDAIKVDGLVLVSRRTDGKIHVDDDFHTAAKGAAWGAVGGAVIGLIFPPALLASAAVGAGLGAGVGGLMSHAQKAEIKADVEADDAAQQLRHRGDVRAAMGRRLSTRRSRVPAP